MNTELLQSELSGVTKDLFKQGIFLAYKGGITSVAPLGRSGDTILLHGSDSGGRKSQVSLRNYGGDIELLITDVSGRFLFYGRYHISMGIDFVLDQYWSIFELTKPQILSEIPDRPSFANIKIADDASYTIGFDMLRNSSLARQVLCGEF